MNIYDFMEETTPKVSMSNYTLRIMGSSGIGKTPAYATFARELSKREYSGKVVCGLLPLEDRYDHINGLMVIKPAMKDKMGRVLKDANGKPKLKKIIENWDDYVEVVDKLVDAKLNIPDFPLERICIDTTTKLEMLAQQQVVKLWFQESSKLQDFNETYGGFGRGHAKAIEICRIEKRKLESVGYKVDQIVQARVKSQVKPITGQEYHVVASDSGEGFDGKVFLQDASISFYIVEEAVVGQTGVTKQGKVINGLSTNGKVFMLNSDGEYKGCKSPFPNTPTSIPADDFDSAVSSYFDLFEREMSKLSGISSEQYKEKANIEKIDLADKLKENLDTIKHELQEESANNVKTEEVNKFISYYESIKKTFPPESIKQCQDYFNMLMVQQNKTTMIDTLLSLDDNTLNGIYANFGFTK